MLKSLNLTKKQLAARFSSSSSCGSSSSGEERHASHSDDYVHRTIGSVKPNGDTLAQLAWSSAGYAARSPFGDITLMEADRHHVLAAVMSCSPSAQGGRYLQRMLAKELAAQLKYRDGDVQAALPGALAALNTAFRNLHPFNGPVLDGVRIALAYMDLQQQVLHTASNGGCRIVVGRARADGSVGVVADVGHSIFADTAAAPAHVEEGAQAQARAGERDELLGEMRYATIQLRPGVDTVIIGSEGLWRELPSQKALLRLAHFYDEAPEACGANAAVHLTNYALHAVAVRSSRLADPRMRSLRSVGHLQSLWTGDRSMYRWGKRQPVRRRRGDVHGDLSAVVMRLAWNDDSGSSTPTSALKKAAWAGSHLASALLHPLQSRVSPGDAAGAAHRRWALLRMHFVTFPAASRRATLERWADVISAALEAARVAQHRRHAAELLLRWDPSSSRMRSGGSLGAAEQAARLGSLGSSRAALLAAVAERQSAAAAALDSLPSGQPLVMSAPSSVASSRSSSASSYGLSWQQRGSDLSSVGRTVSRRNLLAPPPPMQQQAGGKTDAKLPVHHEWQAYEQHVIAGKGLVPVAPRLLQQDGPSQL